MEIPLKPFLDELTNLLILEAADRFSTRDAARKTLGMSRGRFFEKLSVARASQDGSIPVSEAVEGP